MEKRNRKKIVIAVLVAAVVVGTSLGGRAIVSAASREEAKKAALASVPADVTLVEQEEDDGKYEFTFRTADGTAEYEVEVGKTSGTVKEVHMSLRNDRGAETATLTEEEAAQAVQSTWTGAVITSIRLVQDDGRYLYEVRFEADACYGSAEVHAGTGVIVESDVKPGAPIVVPNTAPDSGVEETEAAAYLTSDQIRELALAKVPEGKIREVDFEREDGRYIYEVDIYQDGTKYELTYDATTGEELSCKTEKGSWNPTPVVTEPETTASTTERESAAPETAAPETTAAGELEKDQLIGEEKARSIALGKAKNSGAVIIYIKLDREDGRKVYEGEMTDDGYEYEFEIDAYTGTVIDWDVDKRDSYDD